MADLGNSLVLCGMCSSYIIIVDENFIAISFGCLAQTNLFWIQVVYEVITTYLEYGVSNQTEFIGKHVIEYINMRNGEKIKAKAY